MGLSGKKETITSPGCKFNWDHSPLSEVVEIPLPEMSPDTKDPGNERIINKHIF